MNNIDIIQKRIAPLNHGVITRNNEYNKPDTNQFDKILVNSYMESKGINFSKHSVMRMQERNITLSMGEAKGIAESIEKAKNKGINEALIVTKDLALVVNTKKSTVITISNKENLKENTFTNIDGAVIM